MTSRQLRLLRAAAASSTATVLAAVSHTIGGGLPPHPLLVVALSVLLIPIAAALIGTSLSATRTAMTVLVAQLAFHVLFHALGGVMTTSSGTGHAHHAAVLGPAVSVSLPDAAMFLSHLWAAALTTAMLWHGERMLRGVASWLGARLLPPSPAPAMRHEAPAAPTWMAPAVRLSPLVASVSLRGPPAG